MVRCSIIGLGKLGASMAAAIASRGFEVIGVDVSQRAVELLNVPLLVCRTIRSLDFVFQRFIGLYSFANLKKFLRDGTVTFARRPKGDAIPLPPGLESPEIARIITAKAEDLPWN
jgi:hypothetical protein